MADLYLPVTVERLPWHMFFGLDGKLLPRVRHLVSLGVVRVIAGATECHAVIDVRRPYWRPAPAPFIDAAPARREEAP